MKLAIWNENCLGAGTRCFDEEKIDDECGDITIYDESPEGLLDRARLIERSVASDPAHVSAYQSRVAHSIREYVEEASWGDV